MNFFVAFGEVIREERLKQGYTLRQICSGNYISIGHLSDVERGQKECSHIFMEKVARGLNIPLYELIIETGYRMAEYEVPDTIEDFIVETSPIRTPA
jgi:transcriptional regulator with XRE-family HTH domain